MGALMLLPLVTLLTPPPQIGPLCMGLTKRKAQATSLLRASLTTGGVVLFLPF